MHLRCLKNGLRTNNNASKSRSLSRHSIVAFTSSARVAVGIDLGTTSSAVALINEDGRPYILQDSLGKAMVPSVVTYTQYGEVLVGHAAQQAVAGEGPTGIITQHRNVDPSAHFYSVKRLMGCRYSAIQDLASKLSYPVVEGSDGMAAIAVPHQSNVPHPAPVIKPQDVSAHVLRHLLLRAEAALAAQNKSPHASSSSSSRKESSLSSSGSTGTSSTGTSSMDVQRVGEPFPPLQLIHEAVITVPAYFNPAQRAATIEAGKSAGLKRVSLLQEPVAAAMAYGYGTSLLNQNNPVAADNYDTLLVFDLGGGTFDVSVLEGFEGILEVLATDGDAELGGDDYTRTLAELALHKARQQSSLGNASASDLSGDTSSNSAGRGHSGSRSTSSSSSTNSSCNSSSSSNSDSGRRDSGLDASSSSESRGGADIFHASYLLSTLAPSQRLAVLTAAEEAKQKLGSTTQQAFIVLPDELALGKGKSINQPSISSEEAAEAWAPLMARLWKPLYRLATKTCTQFGGRLPAVAAACSSSSPNPGTSTQQENSSSNRSSWEFHMFPPARGTQANGAQKYVAPPRRLTGVVLVGGSTRLPCIRDFIGEVTGMEAASDVNPEEVVALGAALQAGVLVGSVGAGAELADGSYISGMHGRTTGISDAGV